MNLFTTKTKRVLRLRYRLLLLAIIAIVLGLLAKPVLIGVADYLDMPSTTQPCDVLVIQAGSTVGDYAMHQALDVYKSGLARQILLVLHSYDVQPATFGLSHYRHIVIHTLDSLGIPQPDYSVLFIPLQDPYTYNSAVALADTLKGVKSILLFDDNFHIRRSYLTYKKVFEKKNILVRPYTMDIYLNSKNWWYSANGWRRVIDEYIKLTFYWINGYI